MDLTQLLSLQVSQKQAGGFSSLKIQTPDGQELSFLDALSQYLSLTNNPEMNLPQVMDLTKSDIEMEDNSNLLTGYENTFIPFLNPHIEEQEQNALLTMEDNNKAIITTNLNENVLIVENAEEALLVHSKLTNEIFNQGHMQQISSDLGDYDQNIIMSSEKNQEIPLSMRETLATDKTLPDNWGNKVSYLSDEVQAVSKTDNNGTESMNEQSRNLLFSEETLSQIKKGFKETNSNNNFNQSFLSKESNAYYIVNGSQPFSGFIRDDGVSPILKEPEVSPKELPEFLLKQINNNIKFNKLTGSSELSLRLKPEELGKLTLQLLAQNGEVSLKILTENTKALETIEQNLTHLKQTLANQGIKCNNIDVQVSTDSSFNEFMGYQHHSFNQSKSNNKGKYSFGANGKKEIQVEELAYSEGSKNPVKGSLEGLELFA